MTNKFRHKVMIPADVARDLRAGSYEDLVGSIDECLADNKASYVDRDDSQVSTVATFPDYAIVATSEGKFFRVKHENLDGSVKVSFLEQINLPLINKKNSSQYVENYALVAVDALLGGNLEASVELMKGLVSLKEQYPAVQAPSLVEQTLQSHIELADWRKTFQEHKQNILNSLDNLASLESNRLSRKFVTLYDGSLEESEINSFKELVWADLAILSDRLELAHTRVEQVHYEFQDLISSSDDLEEELSADESESLGELVMFADSFVEDVEQIRDIVAESIGNTVDPVSAAQIYDIIAEGIFDLEVTSHFLTDTINKLTN